MAQAIELWLTESGRTLDGGVIVSSVAASDSPAPDAAGLHRRAPVREVTGDHPLPGPRSAAAARAIADLVPNIPRDAEVHVAISGGASSLIAGPLDGIPQSDLQRAFDVLLTSGLEIREMNAVRKRLTRWSAGRLGLALTGRRIHVWIISDVPGDDPGSIASGPCTGDHWTAGEVERLVTGAGLMPRLPQSVRAALIRETPKPDDPGLAAIHPVIVANNEIALSAAARCAQHLGVPAELLTPGLNGDAARMGEQIAGAIRATGQGPRRVLIWGGETTVTIAGTHGTGGRSQELALSAAGALFRAGTSGMLLAAGTDGRDGPTDAAGAVVDESTWPRIAASGRNPGADLAHHNAYPALDAVGALLRTGPTGTNVMDLAFALTGSPATIPS